jgi:hypothetical protein
MLFNPKTVPRLLRKVPAMRPHCGWGTGTISNVALDNSFLMAATLKVGMSPLHW